MPCENLGEGEERAWETGHLEDRGMGRGSRTEEQAEAAGPSVSVASKRKECRATDEPLCTKWENEGGEC